MPIDVLGTLDPRALGRELKAARIRCRMTQEQAARLIGVARTTLVAIEQGDRRLKPEELVALAHGYGRQVGEFVRQRPRVDAFEPQFRGPADPSDDDRARIAPAVSLFEDLCRSYLELEELTSSPLVRRYPQEYRVAGLPVEQAAESVAAEERNRLRLGDGPIPMIRDVLEQDVGLRVFLLDMPPRYAEIYVYTDQLGGCLAGNRLHPEERRRWSLSHGYAHFLVHRRQGVVSAEGTYQRRPEHERFADAFARFFLMPTAGLVRRFNDVRQSKGKVTPVDLYTLSQYFGVSMEALMHRAEDLRLVQPGRWEEFRRSGSKVGDLRARAGLEPRAERADRYPLRYRYLALEAFDLGLLTEGQLGAFLDVSRVEGRLLVEEAHQGRVEPEDRFAPQLEAGMKEPAVGAAHEEGPHAEEQSVPS